MPHGPQASPFFATLEAPFTLWREETPEPALSARDERPVRHPELRQDVASLEQWMDQSA